MQEVAMKVHKMERSYLAQLYHLGGISRSYLAGNRLQEKSRQWLSAPDPWTNHNVARKAHYRGTATWFTQGDMFEQWKRTGRLLWIQGLRTFIIFVTFATAQYLLAS